AGGGDRHRAWRRSGRGGHRLRDRRGWGRRRGRGWNRLRHRNGWRRRQRRSRHWRRRGLPRHELVAVDILVGRRPSFLAMRLLDRSGLRGRLRDDRRLVVQVLVLRRRWSGETDEGRLRRARVERHTLGSPWKVLETAARTFSQSRRRDKPTHNALARRAAIFDI